MVGRSAAQMAVGLGAEVVVLDRNIDVLRALDAQFGNKVKAIYSTADALEKHVLEADLVIGGVLIPGAAAPKLVTAEHIKAMKPGAAIVDVAIDQGGCIATSKATTHADPTFIVDEVVHYCVANMPASPLINAITKVTPHSWWPLIKETEKPWGFYSIRVPMHACKTNVGTPL